MNEMNSDMNLDMAQKTLESVFSACNFQPNTTPLTILSSRKQARMLVVTVCIWISGAFLVLCLLSPFCFYNRSFRVRGVTPIVTVEKHYIQDNCFTIEFGDGKVDYDKITITDENGNIRKPDEIDPNQQLIRVYNPEGTLTFRIPNKDGRSITAILSVKKES